MIIRLNKLKLIIRTAFFIAIRSFWRGPITVKIVTVFLLMLTLLNLTVVGGLLNGITEDVGDNIRRNFVGDIFIEPLAEYDYIQNENDLFSLLKGDPGVAGYSARLLKGVTLEYDYKNVSSGKNASRAGATLTGIDVDAEKKTTSLADNVIAGGFLESNDLNAIVLGSSLVDGYSKSSTGNTETLGHVLVGDKVRARFANGNTFEFTVVGITNTKASNVDQRAFVNYKTLKNLSGLVGNEYSEIAIKTNTQAAASSLVEYLKNTDEPMGYENDTKEADQALPTAIADLKKAFAMIGNIVGATALLVGLVTVFVVIFVNASSRRKQLGILKALGIEPSALILSYVFQALFYAFIGAVIGLALLFFFLQGYFERNPLSLPMADGELLLGFDYVRLRIIALMVSAIISGFIPAWFIIRQNTLNAILGR